MIPEHVTQHLLKIHEACRARYPTVDLPFEAFSARAREIVDSMCGVDRPEERHWVEWMGRLDDLKHSDLYLVLACAAGDRIAWEYFADEYLPAMRALAAKACRSMQEGEDLAHELIAVLLGQAAGSDSIPESAGQPSPLRGKLAGYDARASLLGWLRVVIAHAAIDRQRRRGKESSLDEMMSGPAAPPLSTRGEEDRAAESMDARWGPLLSRMLADVVGRLPARDRLLLALYYGQDVPLRLIGRQFGVHEATASRWLEAVRGDIRRQVERECRGKHGLSAREVKRLWHWISESGTFSLAGLLGTSREEAAPASGRLQDPPAGSSVLMEAHRERERP